MSKSEEPLANIFAIAAENNVVITSAIVKVPSLEDVFLHLTGKALKGLERETEVMLFSLIAKQMKMLIRNKQPLIILLVMPLVLITIFQMH